MSLALGAGEIDLTNRLPKPDYERFNSDPDFTVVVAPPTLAIWVLGMVIPNENGGHPAFADPKVRQALYRCIDRERVANETFEGLAQPKNILWPPFSPGYDDARDRDYFDPEEAARLLEEAGYGPGELTIELGHGGGEANEIAQVIQAGAAEAGINLNIQLYEPAVARDRFLNAKHESYLSSYAFFALHPQTLPVMNFQMRIPNSCAYEPDYYQALIDSFGTAETDAQPERSCWRSSTPSSTTSPGSRRSSLAATSGPGRASSPGSNSTSSASPRCSESIRSRLTSDARPSSGCKARSQIGILSVLRRR